MCVQFLYYEYIYKVKKKIKTKEKLKKTVQKITSINKNHHLSKLEEALHEIEQHTPKQAINPISKPPPHQKKEKKKKEGMFIIQNVRNNRIYAAANHNVEC